MKYPSQDYLKSIFTYCKETGILTRKPRPREHFSSDRTFSMYNETYAGKPVSARNELGYVIAIINKKQYRAHRIAWIMEFGDIDGYVIDHINGVTDDNRLNNLRLCSHSQNLRNMKKKDTELPLGIYFDKSRGAYKASVGLGEKGKAMFKRFKSVDDAVLWRDSMTKELGYHDFHGKKKGA